VQKPSLQDNNRKLINTIIYYIISIQHAQIIIRRQRITNKNRFFNTCSISRGEKQEPSMAKNIYKTIFTRKQKREGQETQSICTSKTGYNTKFGRFSIPNRVYCKNRHFQLNIKKFQPFSTAPFRKTTYMAHSQV